MSSWQTKPTAASRLMARAMHDHPEWTYASIAHATGLKEKTVSRWLKAEVKPRDEPVAIVARALGYDPRDFGVTDPRALAASGRPAAAGSASTAPDWAVRMQSDITRVLDILESRA